MRHTAKKKNCLQSNTKNTADKLEFMKYAVKPFVGIVAQNSADLDTLAKYIVKKVSRCDYYTDNIQIKKHIKLEPFKDALIYHGNYNHMITNCYLKCFSLNKQLSIKNILQLAKRLKKFPKKFSTIDFFMIMLGYVQKEQVIGLYSEFSPFRIPMGSALFAQCEFISQHPSFNAYTGSSPLLNNSTCITFFNDIRRL